MFCGPILPLFLTHSFVLQMPYQQFVNNKKVIQSIQSGYRSVLSVRLIVLFEKRGLSTSLFNSHLKPPGYPSPTSAPVRSTGS